MLVLGIVLETTGLSTKEDEIIELGAVVWDTAMNKPVAMLNHLIKQHTKDKLSSTIIDITDKKMKISLISALIKIKALGGMIPMFVE